MHRLKERIGQAGPITIEAYIDAALWDAEYGYYATKDPIGARGHFTTAPEISQMFGELIGLWAASFWDMIGRPKDIKLVELGPGRGTMMADVLRAIGAVCDMQPGIHLVECSQTMRAQQKKQVDAVWHNELADVPTGSAIILANEFFDALPIRQIVKSASGWREVMLGLSENGELQRQFGDPVTSLEAGLPTSVNSGPEGSLFEISPARDKIIEEIARRLKIAPGAALIVDYGHGESAAGESLQALGPEGFTDPFCDPGAVDLSSHVDFGALGRTAEGAGVAAYGPITQKAFLERLGINERADMLKGGATAAQRAEIESTVMRLTTPAQMGSLFKVLALTTPGLPAPPGFAA